MKKFLSRVREWASEHKLVVAGAGFLLAAHCLDIISTELVMAFVKGSGEGNVLMRDPQTLKFLIQPALIVKGIGLLRPVALAAFAIAGGSDFLASLPFFWDGFQTFDAIFNNFIVLWKG